MTAEEAEGMITDKMAKENLYTEDLLMELDSRYVGTDILEKMVMGDLNINQNEKRDKLMEDLKNELKMQERDSERDEEELLDLLYDILEHEEYAESEREENQ